jgi:hypothetical protein
MQVQAHKRNGRHSYNEHLHAPPTSSTLSPSPASGRQSARERERGARERHSARDRASARRREAGGGASEEVCVCYEVRVTLCHFPFSAPFCCCRGFVYICLCVCLYLSVCVCHVLACFCLSLSVSVFVCRYLSCLCACVHAHAYICAHMYPPPPHVTCILLLMCVCVHAYAYIYAYKVDDCEAPTSNALTFTRASSWPWRTVSLSRTCSFSRAPSRGPHTPTHTLNVCVCVCLRLLILSYVYVYVCTRSP